MCGIAGLLTGRGRSSPSGLDSLVETMTATLVHRGPDAGGVWTDADAGVGLGHRRLSILDLSPAGQQPMVAHGGRYVVAFNGEIYNFQSLRAELEQSPATAGYAYRGHSDTEVLLAAVAGWGLEKALRKFNGMFAFALWDRQTRTLHLARDRVGKKPLYYGWCGESLLFGSELKALKAHPAFNASISRSALGQFLRFSYIPAPYSIFEGVFKLPPGCYVSIQSSAGRTDLPTPTSYWSMQEAVLNGMHQPYQRSYDEALGEIENLLLDAVAMRMVADVPLGAFLSGGIDSSLVVALMQKRSANAVKTFTIGFAEKGFNEAPHAGQVAKHLGTQHTELYVDAHTALATIPRMPHLYDEPLADPSQIPTFLVSELTRRHVTVALSGDGGDEFFCGYDRYKVCAGLWRKLGHLPPALRVALSRAALIVPPNAWRSLIRIFAPLLQQRIDTESSGATLHRLARMAACTNVQAFYSEFISFTNDPTGTVVGAENLVTALDDPERRLAGLSPMAQMMYLDSVSYLHDDVLAKVDRASMGVSLEVRNPLLDHRLIELAWSLPEQFKFHQGQGKRLLRDVLYRHVPKEIIDRPKMGFGVPITEWLRGPLREWADALLDERLVREQGLLRSDVILPRWQAHRGGKQDWGYYLWNVLMFQAWLADQ